MKELGWFSAAFSLTLVPTLVLTSVLNKLFLPQLSEVQDDAQKFARLYPAVIQGVLLVSVMLLALLVVLGPAALLALYGAKYQPALAIVILLGAMQALRLAKAGPAIVSLARAEATNPLLANVVRGLALPVAWLVVLHGGGVVALIMTAVVGEAVSYLASLLLLRYRMSLKLSHLATSLSAGVAVIGLVILDSLIWPPGPELVGNLHVSQLVILVPFMFMLWHMQPLRSWFTHFVAAKKASDAS